MRPKFDLGLYLVTDPLLAGPRGIMQTVAAAAAGGVTIVQLRDPAAKGRELVDQTRALRELLLPSAIPLIVNDRVDVAVAAAADGVHVGQSDITPADARALIGPDRILGLSITSEADLAGADLRVVDYLGVGPIFAQPTKPDAAPAIGIDGLAAIARRASLPIVAIGGIKAENAADVIAAGASGIAVVSAIMAAYDPEAEARKLRSIVAAALV